MLRRVEDLGSKMAVHTVRSSLLLSLLCNEISVDEGVMTFRPCACDSDTPFPSIYHAFRIPTPTHHFLDRGSPHPKLPFCQHRYTRNSSYMRSPSPLFTLSVLSNFPVCAVNLCPPNFAVISLSLNASSAVTTSAPSSSSLRRTSSTHLSI